MPLSALLSALAPDLAKQLASRAILGTPEQQAIERVYSAALAHMIETAAAEWDEPMQQHLDTLMRDFVQDAQIADYLILLVIRRQALPLDEMRQKFVALGNVPRQINFDALMVALSDGLKEAIPTEAGRDGSALSNLYTAENLQIIVAMLDELIRRGQSSPRTIACNQVPRPPHFAGRENELKTLSEALNGDGKIAITTAALAGVGGIGKTTLAQGFVYHAEGQFGLKLWASLGEYATADVETGILKTWAEFAGKPLPEGLQLEDMRIHARAALAELMQVACGEPVLVVLDNVWPDTLPIAKVLREKVVPMNAKVLLTTRSDAVAAALDIPPTALHTLPAEEGAALVLERLGTQYATAAEKLRPQLKELSTILGGHPLALVLMTRQLAGKKRSFTSGRLEGVLKTLREGMESGQAFKDLQLDQGETKAESVSVSLKYTLDRLGDGDAAVQAARLAQFRALGVLPVEVPVRTAHVWALWGTEDEAALDEFLAEGLLDLVPDAAAPGMFKEGLYKQHRLLRAYARSLLKEAGELETVQARHIAYVIEVAYQGFSEPPETWGALEDELPQIHALGNWLAAEMAKTAPSQPPPNMGEGQGDAVLEGLRDKISPELMALLQGDARLWARPRYERIEVDTQGQRWADADTELDERLFALSDQPPALPADAPVGTSYSMSVVGACEAFAAAVTNYVFKRYVGLEGRRWLWAGLAAARANGSQGGVRLFAGELAGWHRNRGYMEATLAYRGQSLAAAIAQDDKRNQAAALNNIGRVYDALGEKQRALGYYEQALPLRRAVGDRGGEATTLNNIGAVYNALGEKQQALAYYEQALPLVRAVGDRGGEATTLNNIGGVYNDLGEKQQALGYFEEALPLRRAVGDRGGEATTLTNIGAVYDALGEKQKALGYYEQALPHFRAVGDRGGEATMLNNIGAVYDDLGEKQQALGYFEEALPLRRAVGDRGGEATTLNSIGAVYQSLGENRKALGYYEEALPLRRAVGDRGGEATTLNNIGSVYNALGEKQRALAYYEEALPLRRAVGDQEGIANSLYTMSFLVDESQALEWLKEAHTILIHIQSPYANLIAQRLAELRGESVDINAIAEAFVAFVNTKNWDEAKAVAIEKQALLLHPLADGVIGQIIQGQSDAEIVKMLQNHRNILRMCREMGIEAAFERVKAQSGSGEPPDEVNAIAEAFVAFVNTKNWDEAKVVAIEKQALLLHPLADGVIGQIIQGQSDAEIVKMLQNHRNILRMCQEIGIEAAFERVKQASDGVEESEEASMNEEEAIEKAISAFVSTQSWGEARQVLEKRRDVLLKPEADAVFEKIIARAPQSKEFIDNLRRHQRLLGWCRRMGIEAGFVRLKEELRAEDEEDDPGEGLSDEQASRIQVILKALHEILKTQGEAAVMEILQQTEMPAKAIAEAMEMVRGMDEE